jgi:hypothetical protein
MPTLLCLRVVWTLLVAGALVTGGPVAASQDATAPELKAAFLINFVRFTTWPVEALPLGVSLTICVAGDNRVADAIEDLAGRQRLENRKVLVRRVKDDAVDGCHLLYWSASHVGRGQKLLRTLSGTPVLTVSDSEEFMKFGGIASFFVDNGKMRFAVNPSAAERAQLRISSKLLSLARIVKDGSNAIDS